MKSCVKISVLRNISWFLFLCRYLYFLEETIVFYRFFPPNHMDSFPNGHIFVDSPSIRRRNSTWKIRGNYIDFERRIHVEIMTSIRRGYFHVDLTLKIDEILMSY